MSGTPKQNYLYSPPSYTSSSNTMTVVVADAIESTIYIVDLDRSDHEQLMMATARMLCSEAYLCIEVDILYSCCPEVLVQFSKK